MDLLHFLYKIIPHYSTKHKLLFAKYSKKHTFAPKK